MSEDVKNSLNVEPSPLEFGDSPTAVKQVEQIKEAVGETVSETSLPDKVADLRVLLDNLSDEVGSWRAWHKNDYLAAVETLKSQVEEIENEWRNVSTSLNAQHDKLESLLQSVPGIIETATLKALTLRVAHLEQLVSQLFQESQAKASLRGGRKQFIISLVALGVTIILWGVFLILNVIK